MFSLTGGNPCPYCPTLANWYDEISEMFPGSEYLGAIIKSSDGQGEALCPEPSMTSVKLWSTATAIAKPSCPPKPRKPLTAWIKPSLSRAYNLSFISYNSCMIWRHRPTGRSLAKATSSAPNFSHFSRNLGQIVR